MIFSSKHNDDERGVLSLTSMATLVLSLAAVLSACQPTTSTQGLQILGAQDTIQDAPEFRARENKSGFASYLVARRAIDDLNIDIAAKEFATTLADNPANTKLMRIAFSTHYINGDIDKAALLASQIEQRGELVTFGSEPALILAMEARDYQGILAIAENLYADDVSRPLGIVASAWALILQGQGDAGLTRLLDLKIDNEDAPYPIFSQSALMNEYLGRPQDAAAAALMAIDHPEANAAVIINMAGVLARQQYLEQAHDILNEKLGQIFNKDKILSEILLGTSPLMTRPRIEDLLAEAIVESAFVYRDARISASARLYLAERIASDNDRVNYALGLYYQDIEKFDLSLPFYRRIKTESLWNQPVQFIIARYMSRQDNDQDIAKSIYEELITNNPEAETVWKQSADAARRRGDYETALTHYNKAITLNPGKARYYYAKAIVLDELDQKAETEAALRQSILLDPENSYALNYLGYWLLEEGGDPNEALAFIRTAIEKKPQNGYFMDSLGWGFYKLGQYQQAVLYLERAVNLEPVDPIITDHLGDAYAKMGREREAQYQWKRALLFEPEPDLRQQIQYKLEHGLSDETTN